MYDKKLQADYLTDPCEMVAEEKGEIQNRDKMMYADVLPLAGGG